MKIQIFADDHNPPHFHVVTTDHEAMISIESLSILRGTIRRRDLETAFEWARNHQSYLIARWSELNG